MPWFPDFVSAVELARRQARADGHADPVGQYFAALDSGDASDLEDLWPGEVVVHDPRAGEIRGHQALQKFVLENRAWLSGRVRATETVAATRVDGRAVVELLVHMAQDGQQEVSWPVAVVAESRDESSMVFRTYCSQRPVDGRRHLRPPVLESEQVDIDDVVGRYESALESGDADAVVETFAPDGYVREPVGAPDVHSGPAELHTFFAGWFSAGGGVTQQPCAVTDDGVRCALEYNCVRWGSHDFPAQAGLAVYERAPDGLLAAVRVYDDIVAPVDIR